MFSISRFVSVDKAQLEIGSLRVQNLNENITDLIKSARMLNKVFNEQQIFENLNFEKNTILSH